MEGLCHRFKVFPENFRSYHNYLRITRILKCLGEFGYEHLKANFVRFVLREGVLEGTLPNLVDSCVKYWIGVIKDDTEREELFDLYEELQTKADTGIYTKTRNNIKGIVGGTKSTENAKKVKKKKIVPTKPSAGDDEFSDDEGTLEYAMKLIESDGDNDTETETQVIRKTRTDHDISDSSEESMTNESQEMAYWSTDKGQADANHDLGSDEVKDDQSVSDVDKNNKEEDGKEKTFDGENSGNNSVDKEVSKENTTAMEEDGSNLSVCADKSGESGTESNDTANNPDSKEDATFKEIDDPVEDNKEKVDKALQRQTECEELVTKEQNMAQCDTDVKMDIKEVEK